MKPIITRWVGFLFLALLVAAQAQTDAAEWSLDSTGLRYGFPGNKSAADFELVEGFVRWDTPWQWDLGKEWRLDMFGEVSAAWLSQASRNAFLGGVGPGLSLSFRELPVHLEGAVLPSYLSHHHFAAKDLGTPMQFASRVGLRVDVLKYWGAGYHYEHISNAGLSSSNPGLNLHVFEILYRF